ncbi:MAG: ribosome maturation factor RimP [Thomasclavelia sp.]|jgi:ribosome maturation factor RimP|nr:ribosome maturation factor RimP [Thomasclavelia sp.]
MDLENIKNIVMPCIESNDCFLYDIEYVNEKNEWYLRIYIDKNEGHLDMDTCVLVSQAISEELDRTDPIKDEYYLEVSSPGAEAPLKDFEQVKSSIGKYVYATFKNPTNGLDAVEGFIKEINDQDILFEYKVKNITKKITINYENIKFIRLAVKF